MNRLYVFIFLIVFGYIVYYVINLLIKKRITENFDGLSSYIPNTALDHNDSHYFLQTSVQPGKIDIANLKERNPHHSDYYYVQPKEAIIEQTDPNVVEHRPSKLDTKTQLTCVSGNHPLRDLIKKYQPYMYDSPEIINYYDYPFYRDWRYPERPIDPKFLANPEKYVAEYPYIYPSYKYISKW